MKPKKRNNGASKRPSIVASLGFGCVLWLALSCKAAEPSGGELQKAEQVRRLTTQEADRHIPVRLRGVVTFFDTGLYSHFVQDDTAGIYLNTSTNLPPLVAGQSVEVEGVTGAGEYAPIVLPTKVRILGEAPLPAANPVSAEQLVGGEEDSQYVEAAGIVRAVQFEEESKNYLIDIVAGGERFTAYIKELPIPQTEALVDSVVKVRGVCSTLFNRQRQLFGFRLLVPRAADLAIEKLSPANPFAVPAQSIASLLQFTAKGTYGHRVKVAGTVTYQEPGKALFIQDEKGGLFAQTRQRTPVSVGDRVEILGFTAKGEYTPKLQDAFYRKIGTDQAPEPDVVDLDETLKGAHDCRLVRLQASLLDRTQRGREQFLVLETGGFVFNGYLGQDEGGVVFAHAQNGSQVAVSGICLIERGSGWLAGEGWRAKSFRLLLRSPADVAVLKPPPWWTQGNVVRMLGILAVAVLAVLVLVDILRRRGHKKE